MGRTHSLTRKYVLVYVALLALVALTVGAARIDLGTWSFVVALLIAGAKTVLIAMFFMHLIQSTPISRLAAVAGLVSLAILLILSLADYWSRDWLPSVIDRH